MALPVVGKLNGRSRFDSHCRSFEKQGSQLSAKLTASLVGSPTLFYSRLWVVICSVRPRTEGEGAGAALTHSDRHQQKPELHGQILGAAGDARAQGSMALPIGSWLLAEESRGLYSSDLPNASL